MANRNSFCARFINYVAVLILAFLSSSVFAAGGSFGGGGAGGSWGEPEKTCEPEKKWVPHYNYNDFFDTPNQACSSTVLSRDYPDYRPIKYSNGYCVGKGGFQLTVPVLKANPKYDPKCEDKCPEGYEKDANGKCQPKKCPVGETLVNGQCQKKQCPAGQALDTNGNCMPRDDQCPAGQKMVNGRCTTPPPDDSDDPNSEWPPFCEWASVMCQWHQEWQQWSNDYAANEEKANLDREELKRLSLDSKEILSELNQKSETANQKLEELKISLNEIKQQDYQFYDEVRHWLNNFNPDDGTPSEQNPSILFPPFCDWSVHLCNWYLDWQDWRDEYNAHNEQVIQKFDEHLLKLDEQKERDEQFYQDWEFAASNVVGNQRLDLEQNKKFFDDVREFFGWYKDQSNNETDPTDPNNPENQDGNVDVGSEVIPFDESQKITFVNGCPAGEQFNVSFMGQSHNIEFSYQPLCQFMSMIRPFVIAIAYLIGAYILMGLSRGSSE
ncbi:EB domain-containing protein [Acinetobacter haemolyticus]|uniref:EB domain-containing protein n=1 Tax=Acinetobacter haemolyticus TaxID=29430 RepID=UPI000C2B5659|nr:EB domain-containing protein [Acinetobacter haemolyticus]ATZ66932.1 hypothetical protein BSR56_05940 [Acinetobacter haemolyticus]